VDIGKGGNIGKGGSHHPHNLLLSRLLYLSGFSPPGNDAAIAATVANVDLSSIIEGSAIIVDDGVQMHPIRGLARTAPPPAWGWIARR
jgi:hypothetical protein